MGRKLRQQHFEQAQLFHQEQCALGALEAERAENFLDQARHRGLGEVAAMTFDRRPRRRLDREIELGREAHRANHPDRILAHAHLRIADRADQPRMKVGDAADIIDHLEGARIVKERVDREVAPKRVLFRRAEGVVVPDHRIVALGNVLGAPAKGRDLDVLRTEKNVDEPKAAADQARIAKQIAHLLRMSRGRDVEVLGPPPHHQVAHTAADQIAGVVCGDQAIENLEYVRVDIAPRYRMLRTLQNRGFHLVSCPSSRWTPIPGVPCLIASDCSTRWENLHRSQ